MALTEKAAPHGYNLCLISASQSVNLAVSSKLPNDLTLGRLGITQASSLFYPLYHSRSALVKSAKDLIAYSKATPNKLLLIQRDRKSTRLNSSHT